MNDADRIDFPVDIPVTIDASDLQALNQQLQAADAEVQKLQQHALQLVNSFTGLKFPSFDRMVSSAGGAQSFAGIDPKIDAALAQLTARAQHLAAAPATTVLTAPPPSSGGAVPGAITPPGAPTPIQPTGPGYVQGPAAQQLSQLQLQWYQAQVAQIPQTQRLTQLQLQAAQAQAGGAGPQTQQLPPSAGTTASYAGSGNWNTLLSAAATNAGMLNTILPFASGGTTPAQASANQAAGQILGSGGTGGTGSGGGGRARLSHAGLQYVAASLGTAAAAETEDQFNATVAAAGKSVISAFPVIGPTLAKIGAAVAAGVGVGAGMQALGATAMTRQQALMTNVGGMGGSENNLGGAMSAPNSMLRQIYQAGVQYYYTPTEASATADQLGASGMARSAVVPNLRNALAFSRVTGASTQTSADLVNTLSVQGGRSPQQIDQIFQNLYLAAEKTGEPMSKLIDSLQTIEKATGGAARSLYDVAGVAAVQKILGPSFNVGSMSGAMGATGFSAIGEAAMLGVPLGQYQSMQGNSARIFDAASQRVQAETGGRTARPGADQVAVAQGLLQAMGIDLSQYSPANAMSITKMFLNASPGQGADLASKIAALSGTGTSFQQQGVQVAGQTVSQAQQKLVDADTALAQTILGLTSAILGTGGRPSAGMYTPVPNPIPYTGGMGKPPTGSPSSSWSQDQWRAWIAANPTANMPNDGWSQSLQDTYRTALTSMGLGPYAGAIQVPSHSGNATLGQNLASLYYQAASQYGISPTMLMAQGAWESSFNSRAVGPTVAGQGNAMGIAQFMPGTITGFEGQKGSPIYGDKTVLNKSGATGPGLFNPYNPAQEIQLQAYYMQQLIASNQGNVAAALTQYSGGSQGYAGSVLGNAGHIQVDVSVNGRMQLVDLSGVVIGTGAVSATKKTVTAKAPVGHRSYGPKEAAAGAGKWE